MVLGLLPGPFASAMGACLAWIALNWWYLGVFRTIARIMQYGTQHASETGAWMHSRFLFAMIADDPGYALWVPYRAEEPPPWYIRASLNELILGRWRWSLLLIATVAFGMALCSGILSEWLPRRRLSRFMPGDRLATDASARFASGNPAWSGWLQLFCGVVVGSLIWYVSCPRDPITGPLPDASDVSVWAIGAAAAWYALFVFPCLLAVTFWRSHQDQPSAVAAAGGFSGHDACPQCGYLVDRVLDRCSECGTLRGSFSRIGKRRAPRWLAIPATVGSLLIGFAIVCQTWGGKTPFTFLGMCARWMEIRSLITFTEGHWLILPRNHITVLDFGPVRKACIPFLTIQRLPASQGGSEVLETGIFSVTLKDNLPVGETAEIELLYSNQGNAAALFMPRHAGSDELGTLSFPSIKVGGAETYLMSLLQFRAKAEVTGLRRTDIDVMKVSRPFWDFRERIWKVFETTTAARGIIFENDRGLHGAGTIPSVSGTPPTPEEEREWWDH